MGNVIVAIGLFIVAAVLGVASRLGWIKRDALVKLVLGTKLSAVGHHLPIRLQLTPQVGKSAPNEASECRNVGTRFSFVPETKLDKIASIMAFLTAIVVLVLPNLTSPSVGSFGYQVRVQSKITGDDISGAEVRIEIGGDIMPLHDTTDRDGLARFSIESSYVGKPARLVVEAFGYKRSELHIDLRKSVTPMIIQLELEP